MLEIHPLADIFPMMNGKEWTDFLKDIETNGLLEPITVHEGMIVDGRNRYRATLELGIIGDYTPWIDPGCGLKAWIISKNIQRRQLSPSQLAMLAVKLEDFYKDGAKKRRVEAAARGAQTTKQKIAENGGKLLQRSVVNGQPVGEGAITDRGPRPTTALSEASDAVGASRSTAEKAKQVAAMAPELVPQIEAGTLSVNAALEQLKSTKNFAAQTGTQNEQERQWTDNLSAKRMTLRNAYLEIGSKLKRMGSKEFSQEDVLESCPWKDEELDSIIEFLCDLRSARDAGSKTITVEVNK